MYKPDKNGGKQDVYKDNKAEKAQLPGHSHSGGNSLPCGDSGSYGL